MGICTEEDIERGHLEPEPNFQPSYLPQPTCVTPVFTGHVFVYSGADIKFIDTALAEQTFIPIQVPDTS